MAARREANVRAIAGATLLENTRGYNGRARVPGLIHAAVWDDVRGSGLSREAVRDITTQKMLRAGMDKKYDVRVLTGGPGDGQPLDLMAQIRAGMKLKKVSPASDAPGDGKTLSIQEQIRQGIPLKKAPPLPDKPKSGAPSGFMAEIAGGRAQLKKVAPPPDKPVKSSTGEMTGLGGAMANQITQRRGLMGFDLDTDSDTGEGSAEWAIEEKTQQGDLAQIAEDAKAMAEDAKQAAAAAAKEEEEKVKKAEAAKQQQELRERAAAEKAARDAEAAQKQKKLRERAEEEERIKKAAAAASLSSAPVPPAGTAKPANNVLGGLQDRLKAYKAAKEASAAGAAVGREQPERAAAAKEAPAAAAARVPGESGGRQEEESSSDRESDEGSEAGSEEVEEEEESVPLTTTSPEWKSLTSRVEDTAKAIIDVHDRVNALTRNFKRLNTGGAAGSRDWLAAVCKEIPTAGLRSLLPYAAHWHNEVWPTAFEASTRRDAQEAILHLVDGRAKPEAMRAAADAVLVETQARGFYAEAAAWLAPR